MAVRVLTPGDGDLNGRTHRKQSVGELQLPATKMSNVVLFWVLWADIVVLREEEKQVSVIIEIANNTWPPNKRGTVIYRGKTSYWRNPSPRLNY
jgi:hypothetical protein